jgi:hypothetical protein
MNQCGKFTLVVFGDSGDIVIIEVTSVGFLSDNLIPVRPLCTQVFIARGDKCFLKEREHVIEEKRTCPLTYPERLTGSPFHSVSSPRTVSRGIETTQTFPVNVSEEHIDIVSPAINDVCDASPRVKEQLEHGARR